MRSMVSAAMILVATTVSAAPPEKTPPSNALVKQSSAKTAAYAAELEQIALLTAETNAKIYAISWEMTALNPSQYHPLNVLKFRTRMPDVEIKPDSLTEVGRDVLMKLGDSLLLSGSMGSQAVIIDDEQPRWPFDVITYNGHPCLVAYAAMMSDFNSLRAGPRQRAGHVFSTYLAPAVASLFADLPLTFDSVALFVAYGVRDFANVDKGSKPDVLLAIVSRSAMEKYRNGKYTDAELAKHSVVKSAIAGESFVKADLTFE